MDDDDKDLKLFFEAARGNSPSLSDPLAARILLDAGRVQSGLAARRQGLLEKVTELLGGWAGMGGLAAACAAGVWMGFAPPAALPDPVAILMQSQSETQIDLLGGETLQMAMAEEF